MAFSSPPPAPQRGDRVTFSARVDAFLTWLVALIPQLNGFLSSITAMAAGGANSFVYAFDTNTADSDPGNGRLRLDSATQASSTMLRVDVAPGNGGNVTTFFRTIRDGTSNVKGSVRLQKLGDVGSYMVFDITAGAEVLGYFNFTLVPRTAAGPQFAQDDTVIAFFDRKGDKGDGGGTPTQQQIRDAVGVMPLANGGTGANHAEGARFALGLGNVSNVAPADYPVSTSQQNALNGKLSKTGGDMTGALTMANGVAYRGYDTGGNSRHIVNFAVDNNIYQFTGTAGYIIYSNGVNAAVVGSMDLNGNWTGAKFTGTSDERLKDSWRPLPADTLERFAAIEKAGLFRWTESGEIDGGVGAQSIQEIAPWAVISDPRDVLHVNHGGLNTALLHQMAQRLLRLEAALEREGIDL